MNLFFSFLLLIIGGGFLCGIMGKVPTTLKDFLVADNRVGTLRLIGTLVSTYVGGGVVVGMVQTTATTGSGFFILCVLAFLSGSLIMAMLTPRIRAFVAQKPIYNLADLIAHTHGNTAGKLCAITLIIGMLAMLAAQVMALQQVLATMGQLHHLTALLLAAGGMAIYAALTGLKGDINADQFYLIVMLAGLSCVIYGLSQHTTPITLLTSIPPHILSPLTFGGWPVLLFGIVMGGLAMFMSMDLWLRIFAARSTRTAQAAILSSIPFVLTYLVIGAIAGFYAAVHLPNTPPESIYPHTIQSILPPIPASFVLASLAATILSTANTLLFMITTLLGRNVLNQDPRHPASLRSLRLTFIGTGLLTGALSTLGPTITNWILAGNYVLLGMVPILVHILMGKPLPTRGALTTTILAAVASIVAYPFMGVGAFLPAIALTTLGWLFLTFTPGNKKR